MKINKLKFLSITVTLLSLWFPSHALQIVVEDGEIEDDGVKHGQTITVLSREISVYFNGTDEGPEDETDSEGMRKVKTVFPKFETNELKEKLRDAVYKESLISNGFGILPLYIKFYDINDEKDIVKVVKNAVSNNFKDRLELSSPYFNSLKAFNDHKGYKENEKLKKTFKKILK